MRKHILVGVAGAVLLLLVYSGILALTQGLGHALDQTARLWYWVALLAGGFGIQVGLFSFIRQALRERPAAATASVAASGGVSAGSMVACCAHHLGDVLPLIGLSGLAVFLVRYQVFFIILGVLSNGVGVTVMLETIQRHGLSPRVARWKWDMNRVRKAAMASSALILVVAFFLLR
ncbi:MAG: hypothetical protein Q8P00_05270 [Dehalococcoidia bacterium]|nr:hypothetical protein [Dehalococcoidia bacterium]